MFKTHGECESLHYKDQFIISVFAISMFYRTWYKNISYYIGCVIVYRVHTIRGVSDPVDIND